MTEITETTENTEEFFDSEYLALAAEAALFANGSALGFDKLAAALEINVGMIPDILETLKEKYENRDTAVELIVMEDCAVLATKARYKDIVRRALELRKNQPLSKAALEVLAVVAYHQPVTRAFIDKVRGVESPSVVATLSEKGLIEEKGRLDAPGRPVLYGTTAVFLRTFGLTSAGELKPPEIDGEFTEKGPEQTINFLSDDYNGYDAESETDSSSISDKTDEITENERLN